MEIVATETYGRESEDGMLANDEDGFSSNHGDASGLRLPVEGASAEAAGHPPARFRPKDLPMADGMAPRPRCDETDKERHRAGHTSSPMAFSLPACN